MSPAWPFAALGLQTAALAASAHGAGWPVDDAMIRYAVGTAAGALPSAGLLALWGRPCRDREERDRGAACGAEAFFQGLLVLAIDGAGMYFAMRYVQPFPAAVAPSERLLAGWTVGWTGGTTTALVLPPLLGAPWGEDPWSQVGLAAWLHGALAATLLGLLYFLHAPGPPDDWTIELPLAAGGVPW